MTFKRGDRVKYKDKASPGTPYNHEYRGCFGIVTHHSRTQLTQVQWDHRRVAYNAYSANLELAFLELPYDPNQQGDRDDDI